MTSIESVELKIKFIISDVLEIDVDAINDLSAPRSIPSWKGLNHRKIIEEIEREFDIKFDDTEVDTFVNFKIIKFTVLSYLN